MAAKIMTRGMSAIDRIVLVAMTASLMVSVGQYVHAMALPAHFA